MHTWVEDEDERRIVIRTCRFFSFSPAITTRTHHKWHPALRCSSLSTQKWHHQLSLHSDPSYTFNQKSMNETKEADQLFNSRSWDSDNPSMLCWTNDSSRCRQLRGVQGEIMADLWSQYSGSSVTLGGVGNRLFEFYKFAQLFLYCSRHICVANLFSTFKQPTSQKWC